MFCIRCHRVVDLTTAHGEVWDMLVRGTVGTGRTNIDIRRVTVNEPFGNDIAIHNNQSVGLCPNCILN
jgi:hypothetical protein